MAKIKFKIQLFIILITITSCSKHELVEIKEYKIDKILIKNSAEITLICTHGGEEIKNNKEYYYQTIAINKSTKDTITILTEDVLAYDKMDIERLEFISVYSEDKSDLLVIDIMNNVKIENNGNINKRKPKPYKLFEKVSFNNKFEQFDGRKYPTVIGIIVQSENIN